MKTYYRTLMIVAALLIAPARGGDVIYVDIDATGENDGTSWCNAKTNLRDVLLFNAGDGDEVRVAQGTYYTGECLEIFPCNSSSGQRQGTFFLGDGVVRPPPCALRRTVPRIDALMLG